MEMFDVFERMPLLHVSYQSFSARKATLRTTVAPRAARNNAEVGRCSGLFWMLLSNVTLHVGSIFEVTVTAYPAQHW